jgi:hypothetical protein
MNPSAIQDAIVVGLEARYPAFTVEPHGGNLVEREVPMLLSKAPALLLAITGFRDVAVYDGGRWAATFTFSLVVLGKDTATDARDDLAVDAVFDLLPWLPYQRWGLNEALPPDPASLTADNLYTGSLNNLRIALWGLRWSQPFRTFPF